MVVIFHNVWRYQITTLYTLNIYKLVDDTSHWEKENCWVSSSTPLSPNKENVEIKRTFYPEVEHACMLVACHLTPWTIAHQAPLSMGFSRQEYWNGLPSPPPGDLPNPGIEPASLCVSCIDPPGKPIYWGSGNRKTQPFTPFGSLPSFQESSSLVLTQAQADTCPWLLAEDTGLCSLLYYFTFFSRNGPLFLFCSFLLGPSFSTMLREWQT